MNKVTFRIGLVLLLGMGVFAAMKIRAFYPLIQIASKYRAQMYCSCIHLTAQSPGFCNEWTQNPQVPAFLVPVEERGRSQYRAGILSWKVEAHFEEHLSSCLTN